MKKLQILLLFSGLIAEPMFAFQIDDPFAARREKVINQIGDGVLILMAAPDYDVNRNEYRQDNNFWYFTGYDEPYAVAVIDQLSKNRYTLFTPQQFYGSEIFGGKKPTPELVKQLYHADTIRSIREYPDFLKELSDKGRKVYAFGEINLTGRRSNQQKIDIKLNDPSPIVDELRMIKDNQEIEMLRKAANVTSAGLIDAYKICKPSMYEYEIEAIIEYNYRKAGLSMPGFRSIVGSGSNATILHYDKNIRQMKDGDLLLMDVGAESELYIADITRTIPVNGKFTMEQKEIYELVLNAEEEAIKVMKPGNGNLECHHKAADILINGLFKLGLITDPKSLWQQKLFILYRMNHWLGLDVHDVGSYGPTSGNYNTYMFNTEEKGRPFLPGMVSTIEPGLYFRPDLLDNLQTLAGKDVPQKEIDDYLSKVKPIFQKYIGIGIRIEDDILITKNGNEILSINAPKSVNEIEKLMTK